MQTEINLSNKDRFIIRTIAEISAFLIGFEVQTYLLAWKFNFIKPLGFNFHHIYPPWDGVFWIAFHYKHMPPPIKHYMMHMLLFGALLSTGLLFLFVFLVGKFTGKVKVSESLSHFASFRKIKKMGLLDEEGILIGKYKHPKKNILLKLLILFILRKKEINESYLRFNLNTHILFFAPTRSGKGVGFVIPNLLTYRGSCIVNDVKGENYELTAGYRSKVLKQKVFYFNPTDLKSNAYNPLDMINYPNRIPDFIPEEYRNDETYLEKVKASLAVKDAQTIAEIIVPKPDKEGESSHWINNARILLTGLILYVCYEYEIGNPERSIGAILRHMSNPEKAVEAEAKSKSNKPGQPAESGQDIVLREILKKAKHRIAQENISVIMAKYETERSGIVSTMTTALGLWADPILDAITSQSDFDIYRMRKEPSTLYMATPISDIQRTKPLIRIMITQFMKILGEHFPSDEEKKNIQEILFLLDEFPRLGKMDAIEEAIPIIAGYKVKLALITQDLNQLNKVYGENNEIMANAQLKVTYATADDITAAKITKYLGESIVLRKSESQSGKRFGAMMNQASISVNEQKDTLLTPGELMQLDFNKEIVIITGFPPIKANKIFYYKDPNFAGKYNLPIPDTGRYNYKNLRSVMSAGATEQDNKNDDLKHQEQEEELSNMFNGIL